MNEEYKKKYLKYKIKYLELIGGSTDIQGGTNEATKKTKIYSIFNILRDEKDLEKIKIELKKYNEIYTTDLVYDIADAIGSDFKKLYGENNDKNNGNEIGHIKTYIKNKHIDSLFRKEEEKYKLFIFIVVEFGKLLNCENTPEMKKMIKILNPS